MRLPWCPVGVPIGLKNCRSTGHQNNRPAGGRPGICLPVCHRVGHGDVFFVVRLPESGQHDGGGDGDEEAAPGDHGKPGTGLVAEEDDADDGGRDRLAQHHGRRGDRHAAALQGGGVEHERDDAGRGDRVGGRVTGQFERREAGQHAGGDAEHPVAETGGHAERGGPVRLVELGRGQADHGQARDRHDERQLEHRAHLRGALRARRGAEQADAGHHAQDRRPLPPGQGHADHPRGHHRRHREVRRHEGLDREQREPLQGDELGDEAERVQADAATNRHWCSIRTTRPGSTPPEASSADLWLAARTAIACITEATPYSSAATMAAIRLTSTAHLPRHLLVGCPCPLCQRSRPRVAITSPDPL